MSIPPGPGLAGPRNGRSILWVKRRFSWSTPLCAGPSASYSRLGGKGSVLVVASLASTPHSLKSNLQQQRHSRFGALPDMRTAREVSQQPSITVDLSQRDPGRLEIDFCVIAKSVGVIHRCPSREKLIDSEDFGLPPPMTSAILLIRADAHSYAVTYPFGTAGAA
jgi:hypothetical protein